MTFSKHFEFCTSETFVVKITNLDIKICELCNFVVKCFCLKTKQTLLLLEGKFSNITISQNHDVDTELRLFVVKYAITFVLNK